MGIPNANTDKISIHALLAESDGLDGYNIFYQPISIHALLAESDLIPDGLIPISTSYFYPRSPCGERLAAAITCLQWYVISIHALLAESDSAAHGQPAPCPNFYPRSPCGERHYIRILYHRHPYFYPRSPCGERLFAISAIDNRKLFLSTLSLRRATRQCICPLHPHRISIHALLAESDSKSAQNSRALLRI